MRWANMEGLSRLFARHGFLRWREYKVVPIIALAGLLAVMSYALNMRALGWVSGKNAGLSIPTMKILGANNEKVLLYASPETARYLESVGGNYEFLLKPWINFLVHEKIAYQKIDRLEKINDPGQTVLVLPSVVALGDAERVAIKEFQNRGGNILVTSTLGVRDGAGKWKGYGFLDNLLGVSVPGEISPERGERYLNLFGDLPFGQSYGVAKRIWLGTAGPNPLRLQGGRSAGIITDWARTSTTDSDGTAAVLYDELGSKKHNARWVIVSFAETSWEVQNNAVHSLLANAVGWLKHRPLVYKASWPFPYHAAQVIEMDTEEGFANARRFAAMMEQVPARSTFHVLTGAGRRFPLVVNEIARRHEIAYHGEVHEGFKGQSEEHQARRMDIMQAELRSVLGDLADVAGFRAPFESYDGITEDLLLKHGVSYHVAGPNRSDAREPLFYFGNKPGSQPPLVVLPRTQFDDINLLNYSEGDNAKLKELLISDADQVIQTGALGLLSIHSQNFSEKSPLATAMPDFLDYLKKKRDVLWMAESGAVARWWQQRERLTYQITTTPTQVNIDVTISGTTPLPAVSLILSNPQAKSVVTMRPLKSYTVMPTLRVIDELRTAIIFSGMQPGSYSYSIRFASD